MTDKQFINCVDKAVTEPFTFGPLTPGEFLIKYGIPDKEQNARFDNLLVVCRDGFIRVRSPSERVVD